MSASLSSVTSKEIKESGLYLNKVQKFAVQKRKKEKCTGDVGLGVG